MGCRVWGVGCRVYLRSAPPGTCAAQGPVFVWGGGVNSFNCFHFTREITMHLVIAQSNLLMKLNSLDALIRR